MHAYICMYMGSRTRENGQGLRRLSERCETQSQVRTRVPCETQSQVRTRVQVCTYAETVSVFQLFT
jgi:hypothetical protein